MATTTVLATPTLALRSANPTHNEKTALIEETGKKIEAGPYLNGDWRQKLMEDGFVVVKNVFPKERAQQYREAARSHLQSFGTALDYEDKSTWTFENLPDPSYINTFTLHCIPHEQFMWDIRNDPDIKRVFAKLWGTDKLLVSFDALNVTFPGRHDQKSSATFWPHVDQSPFRNGFCCVQGIASLSESGPKDGGLVVYKGSHKLYREYFDTVASRDKWKRLDSIDLSKDDLKWFIDRGCEQVKTESEPGDVILWDSRTIHFGKPPDDDSEVVRTATYVCYTPAEFATDDDLDLKKKIFESYQSTSHWPHTNIISEFETDFVPAGHVPERKEPLNKVILTDDIKKLAGLQKYDP